MAAPRTTPPLPRGIRQAWGRESVTTRRGPKATLSIPGIARSAVALADSEGIGALSLGRIAQRLGVTPNALYRYVDSRDDLDVVIQDHALGAPAGMARGDTWTENAAAWCRTLHTRYDRHPWLATMRLHIPLAPNSLAWLECLLERLEPSGLGERRALQAASVLDGYVRTQAIAEQDLIRSGHSTPSPAALVDAVGADHFSARLPRVASLITTGVYREPRPHMDDDFEFGLTSILTGLQQMAGDSPAD